MDSTRYEINQEATGGPVSLWSEGETWRDHLRIMLLLICLFAVVSAVTYCNLSILYSFDPDYGRDLTAERAFCADLDQRIISSVYYFDETDSTCKRLEEEVRR